MLPVQNFSKAHFVKSCCCVLCFLLLNPISSKLPCYFFVFSNFSKMKLNIRTAVASEDFLRKVIVFSSSVISISPANTVLLPCSDTSIFVGIHSDICADRCHTLKGL